jgi:hypothetical protein
MGTLRRTIQLLAVSAACLAVACCSNDVSRTKADLLAACERSRADSAAEVAEQPVFHDDPAFAWPLIQKPLEGPIDTFTYDTGVRNVQGQTDGKAWECLVVPDDMGGSATWAWEE